MTITSRPPAPEPAPAEPCGYGCTPSTGWRWFGRVGWQRVCRSHRGGDAVTRRGDYVPDPTHDRGIRP